MDIIGDEVVVLRPGTIAYPMAFMFYPASNAAARDGSIPFGSTITAATVSVFDAAGDDISTDVAPTPTAVSEGIQVDVAFSHSQLCKSGRCVTKIHLTLSTGSVLVKRWDGLKIE
jgi:hypothetical protein